MTEDAVDHWARFPKVVLDTGEHSWTVIKSPETDPTDSEGWQFEELDGLAIGNTRAVEGDSMNNMRYPKSKVLAALKKNKELHIKIVKEAQKGYRERAIELVEQLLNDLQAGKEVSLHIPLNLPANHTDEFDRAIDMLEMCADKIVVLDQSQFQAYVRNKWGWQRDFLASNAVYSMTAAKSADDDT